ncbi:hypothetical protein FXO37_12189 [Capsicum annuum]|nr:hypothetical protein FXO37_12189 [Capsicum annuum]
MIEGDKLYVNNINKSTDEFTVLGYGPSAKVNLSRRSCNCRKYDLVKLPCTHAMAALRLKHGDEDNTSIYNYSLPICSKESYLLAYLEPICAVPLESEWSMAWEYLEIYVLPLDFDPKLRRRKVKHVKGVLEPSRNKKRNKCSKCKRPGHKRITYNLNWNSVIAAFRAEVTGPNQWDNAIAPRRGYPQNPVCQILVSHRDSGASRCSVPAVSMIPSTFIYTSTVLLIRALLFQKMPPRRANVRRNNNEQPQPVDPLNETVSHDEFWAAFQALAQAVIANVQA